MRRLLRRRILVVVIGTGVVGAVAAAVALATSPKGTSTATPLADVISVNTVNATAGPITFRTTGPVEVFHVQNTAQPGFSSGWHKHTGPIIIAMTAGSLTFHRANCSAKTVTAGQAYFEPPGEAILARNEHESQAAAWVTTQIIPPGAAKRIDTTPGFCGID
jgi:quercetin dioxygenase-like cupin family protein